MKKLLILCSVILLVLLPMALVVGCQGEPAPATPTPTPTPAEPTIPAHFTTYTDEAGLFSISYPPDWEPALSLIEGLEEATKELLESIELDLPLERVSAIFFAGVPTEMGYAPNVNIVVESLPGVMWTHDKVVEAEIEGLKDVVDDYHEFSRIKTTISGREATIVEWEGTYPQLGRGHQLQMFMLVGKVAWIVTCTPPSGEFSKYEDDFHAIVRSLRI